MLGLLAWAVMGGLAVHDTAKKSVRTSSARDEAKRIGCPFYYDGSNIRRHTKTGVPCTVQHTYANRGQIYRDYKGNILEIVGVASKEEIENQFYIG